MIGGIIGGLLAMFRNRLGLVDQDPPAPRISTDGYKYGLQAGQLYIQCLTCNRKSFSMGDVHGLYCGHCHLFHDYDTELEGEWKWEPANNAAD